MKTFKARGIVLREVSVGEADKIVVLLLKGRGKLGASAKGARKSGSKFLAAAQLFTYSDFVITQGQNFFALAQTEVIESFYDIRNSYELLCAASHMVKLCDRLTLELEPCDDILKLLIYSLNSLCKAKSPDLVTAAFSLKFLEYSGFAPSFDVCSVCRKSLSCFEAGGQGRYPADAFGLMCSRCSRQAGGRSLHSLSESARQAAEYIIRSQPRELFGFEAAPQVLTQLTHYTDSLFEAHF